MGGTDFDLRARGSVRLAHLSLPTGTLRLKPFVDQSFGYGSFFPVSSRGKCYPKVWVSWTDLPVTTRESPGTGHRERRVRGHGPSKGLGLQVPLGRTPRQTLHLRRTKTPVYDGCGGPGRTTGLGTEVTARRRHLAPGPAVEEEFRSRQDRSRGTSRPWQGVTEPFCRASTRGAVGLPHDTKVCRGTKSRPS